MMKVFVVIHTLRTYAHARGLPQSEHVAAHALTHNPALLVSCLLRLRPHDKLVSPDLSAVPQCQAPRKLAAATEGLRCLRLR